MLVSDELHRYAGVHMLTYQLQHVNFNLDHLTTHLHVSTRDSSLNMQLGHISEVNKLPEQVLRRVLYPALFLVDFSPNVF